MGNFVECDLSHWHTRTWTPESPLRGMFLAQTNFKLGAAFFKIRIKMPPGTGRGLYKNPDKIGLAELKKSLHEDSFCQNIPLMDLSGFLVEHPFCIC